MKISAPSLSKISCLLLGLLAGCTPAPQIIPAVAQVDVPATQARGAGRSIAIEVVDARDDTIVGYRDPARADSAITTSPELLENMRRALEQGYRELGFIIVAAGQEADIELQVRLTEFGYQRAEGGVVRELLTGATVEATSVLPEKTITATYRDAQSKDTVLRPSLAANAEILNGHLDGALSKLVADPRLTPE